MRQIKERYRAAYDACTADDIQSGSRFYAAYSETMRRFADVYDQDFERVVSAFVTLSPASSLAGNLRSLATVCWHVNSGAPLAEVRGFRRFRDKAVLYLTGQDRFDAAPRGPKITAFRSNIMDPIWSPLPCIDGHMICAGLGRDMTMKQAQMALRAAGGYAVFETALRSVCRHTKLPVPWTQAIIWCRQQRLRRAHAQLDLFEVGTILDRPLCPRDYAPFGAGEDWRRWIAHRLPSGYGAQSPHASASASRPAAVSRQS